MQKSQRNKTNKQPTTVIVEKVIQQKKANPGQKRNRNGSASKASCPPLAILTNYVQKENTVQRTGANSGIATLNQPLTTVQEQVGLTNLFTNNTPATINSSTILCCPRELNGPIVNSVQNWSEWRYKSLKVVYHPLCPVTTDGGYAFGVSYEDPTKAVSDLNSFSSCQTAIPSVTKSFWKDWEMVIPQVGNTWYRTDFDLSGTLQDVLGNPLTVSMRRADAAPATVVRGYLTIHGILELRGYNPSQGVTMSVRTMHDRELMLEAYKLLCPVPMEPELIVEKRVNVVDELTVRFSQLSAFRNPSPPGSVGSWGSRGK